MPRTILGWGVGRQGGVGGRFLYYPHNSNSLSLNQEKTILAIPDFSLMNRKDNQELGGILTLKLLTNQSSLMFQHNSNNPPLNQEKTILASYEQQRNPLGEWHSAFMQRGVAVIFEIAFLNKIQFNDLTRLVTVRNRIYLLICSLGFWLSHLCQGVLAQSPGLFESHSTLDILSSKEQLKAAIMAVFLLSLFIGFLFSLAVFFFSKDKEKVKFASDAIKTLSGFFTGALTGYLG